LVSHRNFPIPLLFVILGTHFICAWGKPGVFAEHASFLGGGCIQESPNILKTFACGYPWHVVFLALLASGLLAASSAAQEPASAQQQTPPSTQRIPQPRPEAPNPAQGKSEEEKEIERKEQSQRLLGVVPQFGVTSRHNAPPLSPGEKFHLFVKAAFDPATIGIVGLQAAVSQAEDEFPGYGQGAQGYGKRYGASFADQVSAGFFSNYFWPVLLKEDPRYFRLGEGTIKHRIWYAMEQEFDCKTDKGTRTFAFENALGALSSGGLSNLYYPSSDRGFGLTMSRSGIALLYGSVGGLVDEFWPDINHALFHRRPQVSKTSQIDP
jgi:hypothetical protein